MKNISNTSKQCLTLDEIKDGCEGCLITGDELLSLGQCKIIQWHLSMKSTNECPCKTCLVKVMCEGTCNLFDNYWETTKRIALGYI